MTPPAAAAAPAPASTPRARTAAPPRPRVAPRKPRRVSGPARRPARTAQRRAQADGGLLIGVLAALNKLSRNPSLDRLIRGRTWIALIAFALIGIVTLQLLVLELNAHIGRALVQEAQLQRENSALSIESSELAAGERVESRAATLGLELVPEGALRFLAVDPRADIARAAAALSSPVHAASTISSAGTSEPASASSAEASTGAATAAATSAASEQSAAAITPASPSSTQPSGEASSQPSEPDTAEQQTAPAVAAQPPSAGASAAGAAEAAPGGAQAGTQASGAG
jgi:cell division protein FtsL